MAASFGDARRMQIKPALSFVLSIGVFHAAYGLSWFLGSAMLGFLYDHSVYLVIIFSMGAQLSAGVR